MEGNFDINKIQHSKFISETNYTRVSIILININNKFKASNN